MKLFLETFVVLAASGDVGEPDPVRRGGREVALDQVRSDREVVAAVGGPRTAWPRHDGSDTMMAHQSFDAAAAHAAALRLQLDVNARAAIASAGIAMDPSDVLDECTIGSRSPALRA